MDKCPKCNTSRKRTGGLYPSRPLCICERIKVPRCACKQPAIYVEFQAPITGKEPVLPAASNNIAEFMCAKHAPSTAQNTDPITEGIKAAVTAMAENVVAAASAVVPKNTARTTPALPIKYKKDSRPHIAPVWSRWSEEAAKSGNRFNDPPGANEKGAVVCLDCNTVHRQCDRRLWNGTFSECPVAGCTSEMFTIYEEEDHVRQTTA